MIAKMRKFLVNFKHHWLTLTYERLVRVSRCVEYQGL